VAVHETVSLDQDVASTAHIVLDPARQAAVRVDPPGCDAFQPRFQDRDPTARPYQRARLAEVANRSPKVVVRGGDEKQIDRLWQFQLARIRQDGAQIGDAAPIGCPPQVV
jgi:hypothetical protein